MGEDVMVSRPDGTTFPAYVATAARPGPGVLVVHAYWGLRPHYRELADRLAAAGYCALAPSLFDGRSSDDPDEAEKLLDALQDERAEADLHAATDDLLAHAGTQPGPLGAVGFSMGGWAVTRIASLRLEFAAVVPFYGWSAGSDYTAMRAAIQVHLAEIDDFDEGAEQAFRDKLVAAGRAAEFHVYSGARHGFFNPDHPEDYDDAAARLAWKRTLAFLRKQLPARGDDVERADGVPPGTSA